MQQEAERFTTLLDKIRDWLEGYAKLSEVAVPLADCPELLGRTADRHVYGPAERIGSAERFLELLRQNEETTWLRLLSRSDRPGYAFRANYPFAGKTLIFLTVPKDAGWIPHSSGPTFWGDLKALALHARGYEKKPQIEFCLIICDRTNECGIVPLPEW